MKLYDKLIFIIIFQLTGIICFAQNLDFEKVSDVYTSDYFQDIERYGDKLIASGHRALHLYEVDDEGALNELDELPLWGILFNDYQYEGNIVLIGNNVFIKANSYTVVRENILYKVTIENNQLNLAGAIHFGQNEVIWDILGADNYLFVTKNYNDQVVQIYDNFSFELIAEYNLSESFVNHGISKIDENHLYTIDSENDKFINIYDVSNIYDIHQVATIDLSQYYPNSDIGRLKNYNEDIVFLCSPDSYKVFDISDITNWIRMGEIEFPTQNALKDFGIVDQNTIIVPFENFHTGLYDISDISNPILLDYTYVNRLSNTAQCVTLGDMFYQADLGYGIHQLKIDEASISEIGRNSFFQSARYSYIHNDKIAIRTYFNQGMHIYDMSDLENIYHETTLFSGYNQRGTSFENDLIATSLLLSSTDFNVDIYNIADLDNPLLINRIENTKAEDLSLEYPYLYSWELGNNPRFIKYDISQPFETEIVYELELTNGVIPGFIRMEDYIYYRHTDDSIGIIEGIEGDNPSLIETIEINPQAGFYPVNNNFMLILPFYSQGEIELYDLSNPVSPEQILSLSNATGNNRVGVYDNLLFIGATRIKIYDLANEIDENNLLDSEDICFTSSIRTFFEREDENFVLLHGRDGVSLYRFDYDNMALDEELNLEYNCSLSNYPNPFRPAAAGSRSASTTINYALPQAGQAEIIIYNLKGQKIKTLLSEQQLAGEHSVTWNGRNDRGQAVASGVYLYQLQVDGQSLARQKMMLVK
ncbi:MAG: FlgD immunoglobulin-like domain containing protein [Candidatus Cloacimonadales bacterium]